MSGWTDIVDRIADGSITSPKREIGEIKNRVEGETRLTASTPVEFEFEFIERVA